MGNMRIVLDTNVFVSGLLTPLLPRSLPKKCAHPFGHGIDIQPEFAS
jgi:hypothetical protein